MQIHAFTHEHAHARTPPLQISPNEQIPVMDQQTRDIQLKNAALS